MNINGGPPDAYVTEKSYNSIVSSINCHATGIAWRVVVVVVEMIDTVVIHANVRIIVVLGISDAAAPTSANGRASSLCENYDRAR